MARKQQATIQDTVETDEEFEAFLHAHKDQLICMEVYSDFCGPCLATSFAIRRGKLEIGQDNIAMVKALADNIEQLSRFKNKSEPVFLFIVDGQLIRAMFGANGIELCSIIDHEIKMLFEEKETGVSRPRQAIRDLLPEEKVKLEENLKIEEEYRVNAERLRVLTLAARKKRVNERLARKVRQMNFILFWPHCHKAHYDLYEKWDNINVSVGAKETFQMTEDMAREALYMSDVDPNEACLHALMKGEVLVVLFKMLESDIRNFVKVMRYALYEEIPVPKDDVPPEKQLPPIPAFERYASISKTAPEVRRDRYNEMLARLAREAEEAERLAKEQARLAREAEEERQRLEKQRQEEERMARIAAGLPAEPEPEPEPDKEVEAGEEVAEPEIVQEEKPVEPEDVEEPEVVRSFHSDVEVEGEEYIPPGGLFVPGLYSPPNDLAKANGLTCFFPKQVMQLAELETEYLPPHVLVIFPVDKRYDVLEVIKQHKTEILNLGVFVGDDPYSAEHVAYTIKQYDKMVRYKKHLDRLAVMVSRRRSLALLQLAGLNPCYISADLDSGERECLALFPVGYGDDYEEEESIVEEEEVVVELAPEPEPEPESVGDVEKKEEDEEED